MLSNDYAVIVWVNPDAEQRRTRFLKTVTDQNGLPHTHLITELSSSPRYQNSPIAYSVMDIEKYLTPYPNNVYATEETPLIVPVGFARTYFGWDEFSGE